MTGSSPWWSSHPARLASRWCSRPQACRGGGAVPGGLGGGGHRRGGPGRGVREPERGPVPGRPAVRAGLAGRGGEVHHPVAAQPARHLDRQVSQQPGQPGQVVAGVEDDQDVRVAVVPVPGGDDPHHDLADLRGGHLGRVIGRAQPHRVQRQRPRRAARLQRGDERVRPARDHLRVPLPPRIAVAEQPLRAGLRVRPQPVAHIRGQPDPPVVPGRQRQRGQRPAQPRDLDLAALTASYTAPWPRRHSGSSDSSASMCTRSCLHSTASASSNSASGRFAKHRYSSPRNPASIPRARSSSAVSWTAPPATPY